MTDLLVNASSRPIWKNSVQFEQLVQTWNLLACDRRAGFNVEPFIPMFHW